jgi:hypothetical protein
LFLGQSVLGDITQIALNELLTLRVEQIACSFHLDMHAVAIFHDEIFPV